MHTHTRAHAWERREKHTGKHLGTRRHTWGHLGTHTGTQGRATGRARPPRWQEGSAAPKHPSHPQPQVFPKQEQGDPCLPSLLSWGSATTGPRDAPHCPSKWQRSGQTGAAHQCPLFPMEELPPTPQLDFVLLFSRNEQRASRTANGGFKCEELALQTRTGTCILLPVMSWPLQSTTVPSWDSGRFTSRKPEPSQDHQG